MRDQLSGSLATRPSASAESSTTCSPRAGRRPDECDGRAGAVRRGRRRRGRRPRRGGTHRPADLARRRGAAGRARPGRPRICAACSTTSSTTRSSTRPRGADRGARRQRRRDRPHRGRRQRRPASRATSRSGSSSASIGSIPTWRGRRRDGTRPLHREAARRAHGRPALGEPPSPAMGRRSRPSCHGRSCVFLPKTAAILRKTPLTRPRPPLESGAGATRTAGWSLCAYARFCCGRTRPAGLACGRAAAAPGLMVGATEDMFKLAARRARAPTPGTSA